MVARSRANNRRHGRLVFSVLCCLSERRAPNIARPRSDAYHLVIKLYHMFGLHDPGYQRIGGSNDLG